MIDRFCQLSLLLNLTGLYSVDVIFFSSSRGLVATILLLFNAFYLAYRWPVASRFLRTEPFVLWLVLICLWPIAHTLLLIVIGDVKLAPSNFLRMAGIHLYLATLLLCSGIFVAVRGWKRLQSTVWASVAVTIFGFLLGWLTPAFLSRKAQQTGNIEGEAGGRAFGFFLEPNRAVLAIVALGVVFLTDLDKKRPVRQLLKIVLLMALVAATGSRGGMLVAFGVATVCLWEMRHYLVDRKFRLHEVLAASRWLLVFGTFAAMAFLVLGLLAEELAHRNIGSLGSRIGFFTKLQSIDEIAADRSIEARLKAQRAYLDLIAEEPFLGHGPGESGSVLASGDLVRRSHSYLMERSFEYGILYILFFGIVLVKTYTHRHRRSVERILNSNAVTQLLLAIFCASMVAGGVLMIRGLIAVLGALLACQIFPHRQLRGRTAG